MITGATKVLGLIADPVVQARSPGIANTLLAERGRFGAFALLPLQVPAGALDVVVPALRRIGNFAGAVVSMPHKSAIVPLLDDVLPDGRLVGAVNVFRRDDDGRLTGTTLDGEGFVAGLAAAGHAVRGASCVLVGAGGAGAAIAAALARHGCAALTIVNRTVGKADTLAGVVRTAFPAVRVSVGDGGGAYDVAVNATSLGMRPGDALPMPRELVARSALVAECVMTTEITPLLELARGMGRPIQTGIPMLSAQMDLLLEFMGAG
ncbi:MAG TPA: shikimate dehydrogenase [Candidatus Binatia bacterium]|jgi:shikimate dehydrogenase|nr:shikimate dehydrogenase [Candidatus Binatia bacterium]